MASPNTHREALIAEALGDLQGLIERVEALKASLPADLLERVSADIPKAMGELPERVRAAAREAVGPVTAAAIIAARSRISTEIESVVEETKADVRRAAIVALREDAAASSARGRAIAIAVLVAVALVSAGLGYGAGRAEVGAIRTSVDALAARPDAPEWLNLARANPDLAKTLRENCEAGRAVYVVDSARACAVPLWLEGPPARHP